MKYDMVSRRKFLKWAVTSGVLAAGGFVGLEYLLSGKSAPVQPSYSSESLTSLISKSVESSSTQLYSLKGTVAFDYNGDGKRDGDEPPVQDAKIQATDAIDNSKVIAEALTDSSGDFHVDIPAGGYRLFIKPDQTKSDSPKFKYTCISASEFRDIETGYDLGVVGDGRFDVGLMEGFFTSPFTKTSHIESYVDLDPGPGILDWKGGNQTYNGHIGTDFIENRMTPVHFVAPGKILAAANGWPNNPNWTGVSYYQNGNFIVVDYGNGFYSAYHHLDSIAINETPWGTGNYSVSRGQLAGYVGNTGTDFIPHLHLQLWKGDGFMYGKVDAFDPFRDLYYGKHGNSPWSNDSSFWTVDNEIKIPNV